MTKTLGKKLEVPQKKYRWNNADTLQADAYGVWEKPPKNTGL